MMIYKLGIIGLGHISEAHLQGVRSFNQHSADQQIHVSALVDIDADRAAQWCADNFDSADASLRPAILSDYHQLLEPAHRPDLVSILLPHHLHLDAARPFLEAGVAVQMQKPIGLALRDAKAMIELARGTGTPLVVCEGEVLGRRNQLVLDWLKSGRQIGQPTFMIDQTMMSLPAPHVSTWRNRKATAGGGMFLDWGVHRTFWMLEAFGPCATAFAQTRQMDPPRQHDQPRSRADTEDLGAAVLRFKSGVVCQFTVLTGSWGKGFADVRVWGSRGNFDLRSNTYTLSGNDELLKPDLDPSAVAQDIPEHPFAHSYQELIKLIGDPKAIVVGDPTRAMEAEAVIYACLESAHTGQVVLVDDVLAGRACSYEQTVWQAAADSSSFRGR